ncbi:MAG: PEGA domain-containing protein [Pirellulales bacterium]|nr:PEGA domain-containing protein [Pirellulales bacterium]
MPFSLMKMFRQRVRSPVLFWVLVFLCAGGCVQRRMTIRSNPPGALVYVDDYENPIGMTPCSSNFTYYGTRKIRLVKDGYETLTVMQPIPEPWYEFPPLEFVAENLVPGEIRDQRVLEYQLTPQMVVPTDQLRARAEQLRGSVHAAANVPPGALAPPSAAVSPGTVPSGGVPPGPAEVIHTPPMLTPPPASPSGIGGQTVPALPPR